MQVGNHGAGMLRGYETKILESQKNVLVEKIGCPWLHRNLKSCRILLFYQKIARAIFRESPGEKESEGENDFIEIFL